MILFISFEPGAGGHKFARTVATLPDVYWYSCDTNGYQPWNINSHSDLKGKDISRYHFHRITPWGIIPPTHDLVKDFISDENYFYEVLFKPRYEWIRKNIKEKYVVIPTHEMPKKLKKHFPDCKIIELKKPIGHNVERYIKTTAKFPAYGRYFDIVPEDNEYLKRLEEWGGGRQWHHRIRKRDLWALERYDRFMEWDTDIEEYETYVYLMLENNYRTRSWDKTDRLIFDGDWRKVKTYLNK